MYTRPRCTGATRWFVLIVRSLTLAQVPLTGGARAAPGASVLGTWSGFSDGNSVQALTLQGQVLWAGSRGGLVLWDLTIGSYVQYTTQHGLPDNQVNAVAVESSGAVWVGLGTWIGSGAEPARTAARGPGWPEARCAENSRHGCV